MITNKDIRVENGFLIINGDKFPLDGQSPEAIMQIVEDNSDTTPTAESSAPVTSTGIKTYVDTAIGDLTQTGVTGADVAAQLGTLGVLINGLSTATKIWEGEATDVGNTYNLAQNYTDFKYLLVTAKTNVERKNMLILTSSISAPRIYDDVLSSGAWNTTTNAFTYNSCYGIKFTATNAFKLEFLSYNDSNWILMPIAIYGIG